MNSFVEVIKEELTKLKKQLTQTGTDYIAKVTSVEGSTAHVQIAGSDITDTPVSLSINAKPGDTVRVRVKDGKAWITGNDTAPPTDDTKAIELIENTNQGLMETEAKYSRINQTIDEITLEVGEVSDAADAAQATANGRMKSDMSNKSSSISINSGQIAFNSNSLVVNSTKFTLDANGNATFGGTLNAANGSFSGAITTENAADRIGVNIDYGKITLYNNYSTGEAYIQSSAIGTLQPYDMKRSIFIFGTGEIMIGSTGLSVEGVLRASGTKSRIVKNTAYGDRLLYSYETPTPYFGDIGTGITDENGESVIGIDDIFDETVNANIEYSVFLQKERQGDIWVEEKEHSYFVVKGTPNIKFSWEVKAVQKGYENLRLDDKAIVDYYCADDDVGLSMDEELKALDNEELFAEVFDEELFDVA